MRPRIRTIKPDFFTHEELFDLEAETGLPVRLAYVGLWCHADREGRFQWRPRTLKAGILPHDSADFSRVLDALATRGFVVKYTSGGEMYGWIPTFARHQSINNREGASELPDPNGEGSDMVSPQTPLPGMERNGKGREGKGIARDARDPHACPTRAPRGTTRQTFTPFILSEVAEYCKERDNGIDPSRFIDYYASRGWMLGKTKMKDWKAAVRTWEENDKDRIHGNGRQTTDNDPRGNLATVERYIQRRTGR